MNRLPPASPARRHFMGIVCRWCGKTIDDRNFIGLFARKPGRPKKCRCNSAYYPGGALTGTGVPMCCIVRGAERLFLTGPTAEVAR